MKRVLCLVLVITLGDAAVRYPRGYRAEGGFQHSDVVKNGADFHFNHDDSFHEFHGFHSGPKELSKDTSEIKGAVYVKGGSSTGNYKETAYLLFKEKEDSEKRLSDVSKVPEEIEVTGLNNIVESTDVGHNSDNKINNKDSITKIPSSIFTIGNNHGEEIESNYSSNGEQSNFKSNQMKTLTSDSTVKIEHSDILKSSNPYNEEYNSNFESNNKDYTVRNDHGTKIENSYSSNAEQSIDVKSSDNKFSSKTETSDSINRTEDVSIIDHSSYVKSNDNDSITKILSNDSIIKLVQGDEVESTYSNNVGKSNNNKSSNDNSLIKTLSNSFTTESDQGGVDKSDYYYNAGQKVDSKDDIDFIIKITTNDSTSESSNGSISESSYSSNRAYSIIKSTDDHSKTKTLLNDSTVETDHDTNINNSHSSNIEQSKDVRSSDIESLIKIQTSDPIIGTEYGSIFKNSYSSDAGHSSDIDSSHNGPITGTLSSDSITVSDQIGVVRSDYSKNAGQISNNKNRDDDLGIKPLLNDFAIGIDLGDNNKNSAPSNAGYNVEVKTSEKDSISKTICKDIMIEDDISKIGDVRFGNDKKVIKSSSSNLSTDGNNDRNNGNCDSSSFKTETTYINLNDTRKDEYDSSGSNFKNEHSSSYSTSNTIPKIILSTISSPIDVRKNQNNVESVSINNFSSDASIINDNDSKTSKNDLSNSKVQPSIFVVDPKENGSGSDIKTTIKTDYSLGSHTHHSVDQKYVEKASETSDENNRNTVSRLIGVVSKDITVEHEGHKPDDKHHHGYDSSEESCEDSESGEDGHAKHTQEVKGHHDDSSSSSEESEEKSSHNYHHGREDQSSSGSSSEESDESREKSKHLYRKRGSEGYHYGNRGYRYDSDDSFENSDESRVRGDYKGYFTGIGGF